MRALYVCEGAGNLGWGHLNRGYALWEAAKSEVTLAIGRGRREFTAWLDKRGTRGDDGVATVSWRSRDEPFALTDMDCDVVIVDDYFVDDQWIARVAARRPTFVVDDWMRSHVQTTALVNPNIGASRADYPDVSANSWLLGAGYALLRREVREASGTGVHRAVAEGILVTLGGSDPGGHTAEIANALTQLPWYVEGGYLTIVLGSSYPGSMPCEGWSPGRRARTEVLWTPDDFVGRCVAADLVICGASTTTYELARLGRPFVPIVLVENQARVGAAWAERGVGTGLWVGEKNWLARLGEEVSVLTGDGLKRAEVADVARRAVDGLGVDRVLAALRAAVQSHGGDGA